MPDGDLPLLLAIEQPQPGTVIGSDGAVSGFGWVLAASRVLSVTIELDGRALCQATIGLARSDIAAAYRDYPNKDRAGFRFSTRLPSHAGGEAALRVVVRTAAGSGAQSVAIVLGSAVEPASEPPGAGAHGTGSLAAPMPEASAAAPLQAMIEDARIDAAGILRVRGWAVSFTPIEQIGIFLNERPCGLAEGGISREDVGRAFPDYAGSRAAGFLFQQALDEASLAGGTVRVLITAAGGIVGQLTMALAAAPARAAPGPAERLVRLHCDFVSLSEEGALSIGGWAVCGSGVSGMAVSLGEESAGSPELDIDRPDVGNQFPALPGARKAGFRLRHEFGRNFAGDHVLSLVVRGRGGESQTFQRPVRATARAVSPPASGAAPPGGADASNIRCYLDTPVVTDGVASETVQGFLSLAGWAIAPAGIAGVDVFVDGRPLGPAYFGIRREDIQAAFADVEGALLCGFAMLVPPPVLKRGRHDISLLVRDNAGSAARIEFAVEAEAAGDAPGPWLLRRKMGQAEIDLGLSILAAAGWQARHELLLPLAGAGAAEVKRARQTLASLCTQAYPAWRLRIVLPRAGGAALAAALVAGYEELVPRIEFLPSSGTALADLAPADPGPALLSLLRPGDLLGADALLEVALAGAVDGGADFVYSDERRSDPADGTPKAFFKPDWSPDLLLSTNYIGRLWAASPALLRRVGVRLDDLARFGEYDLVLRVSEAAERIAHVAKVLCTRGRAHLESAASERRALARAAARRGIAATVEDGPVVGTYRLRRALGSTGLVSIIIPTIAARGYIATAIQSIRDKTEYRNFEIIALDNIPPDNAYWKDWLRRNADGIVEIAEEFNWSRFNNAGAKAARGEFLLFLNDDIEVLDGSWLAGLLEHAQRREVGVVGPQLLYPDGKVQHAGMFLARTVARHAFRFAPREEPGPFGLALTTRNVISVTGACLMVRREVFDALGGFDESHAVINNDVDFCLRARRHGLAVVYTPHVSLVHHEMASRAAIKDRYGTEAFASVWEGLFRRGDPYFSPHLTTDYDDYTPEPEPLRLSYVGHPLIARERVRRILVVKLDHIGDFVASFPAFRRLKQVFPGAEVTVLAAAATTALAPLEPAIDRVIEFNFYHAVSEKGRRRTTKRDWEGLERQLAPRRFDLAIDLRRQPDTREVLHYAGATWLAGFDYRNTMGWLDVALEWEGDAARIGKRLHVADALLQLVDALALACETDRQVAHAGPSPAAARDAAAALPGLASDTAALFERAVVCLHVGAGAENKQWPPESFAALIDLLVAEDAVNVALVGSAGERAIVDRVRGLVRQPERVVALAGRVALADLPVLLRAAALFVGNDSGPKHLAGALGVPTVGIHSGTVDVTEWGPMGPAAVALSRDMKCSPCYLAKLADCHRGLACLRGIGVGEVHRACRRLLAIGRPQPPARPRGAGPR